MMQHITDKAHIYRKFRRNYHIQKSNKTPTFRKEPDIERKIKEKGSDNNYFFIVRTPQYADKFPSALRHFLGADLKKKTVCFKGQEYCDYLFHIEKKYKDPEPEERHRKRLALLKPVMKNLK